MFKTKGVHEQYDTKERRGTMPGPSRPKLGPAGPTPLADRPGPGAFLESIFTICQSMSVRGVSNVGKAVEQLNLSARPSCMVGQPNKWASRANLRPQHCLTPPINTKMLPLVESVKKVWFSYL
jgi:hypothetical protein